MKAELTVSANGFSWSTPIDVKDINVFMENIYNKLNNGKDAHLLELGHINLILYKPDRLTIQVT